MKNGPAGGPAASTGGDNTHCQANPPVMPSRSRSLRLRCLEGTAGSSGFMGGGPPPAPPAPLPPPPENNAIPYRRQSSRSSSGTGSTGMHSRSPRPLRRRFHAAHRAAGMITDTVRDVAISSEYLVIGADSGRLEDRLPTAGCRSVSLGNTRRHSRLRAQ